MRRELLAMSGLPVPPGATFAIGLQREEAREFARRIGFPVVVKPAVGDNITEAFPGLQNENQLDEAIDYLRIPEQERATFTRSAYALTLLLEPEIENGRALAPRRYQFLIERDVEGSRLRVLIYNGEVVSAVLCEGQPFGSPELPNRDVTKEIDPSVEKLAISAVHAVPGLAIAAVDIVLQDHRRPLKEQSAYIVDLSERPWLATQACVEEELSNRIGELVLAGEAALEGLVLPGAKDRIDTSLVVEGATAPEEVAEALTEASAEFALEGEVHVEDAVAGTIAGELSGSPNNLALISELLLEGHLYGQRAMLVEISQCPS